MIIKNLLLLHFLCMCSTWWSFLSCPECFPLCEMFGKSNISYKIFLFKDHYFSERSRTKSSLKCILIRCLVLCHFTRNKSPIGPNATKNKWINLIQQEITNKKLAKGDFTAFKHYFWYISEAAGRLSLFDDCNSTDEKQKNVKEYVLGERNYDLVLLLKEFSKNYLFFLE